MAKLRVDKIAAPIIEEEYTGSVHLDAGRDKLIVNGLADFDGQFTIEGWYLASAFESTPVYFGNWATSTGILLRGSTEITLFEGGDGNILQVSNPNVSETGRWYHIALTRDGTNTIRLFIDGVVAGSVVHSDTIDNQTNKFTIGAENGGTNGSDVWNGHISNFRIVQGNALYTDDFEVPTRELEVVDGTVVLCCQSSTSVTEEASGETTITTDTEGGNPTAQEANPGLFRKTNISSTTTENTGSVFFDGTDDFMGLDGSDDFAFGTGGFTIEFWVYFSNGSFSSDSVDPNLIDFRPASTNGLYPSIQYDTSANDLLYYVDAAGRISGGQLSDETWYHIAVARDGTSTKMFVNGFQVGSTYSDSNDYLVGANRPVIGCQGHTTTNNDRRLDGYISNLRICKGHAVYTSNFIPPTRELEVHPETVFLGLYDGENIFADKSGRHNIAAYGDRISSPTPTATDSPIGITTFQPGLTRNVDVTAGPVFQGGAGFASQNWLTLPKGTTTDRNRTGGRGMTGGGNNPANTNLISYFTISSMGNAFDFGDLSGARTGVGACSSSTRGVFAGGGGSPAPAFFNTIEYVTISTTGDTQDFGDLDDERRNIAAVSNQTRGVWAGGSRPASDNVMQYITFATLGNAVNFGDTTTARAFGMAEASSPTRGLFAGGSPGDVNIIDYITIASTGDAIDFGDLITGVFNGAGTSSNTRGIFAGGYNPTLQDNIEYVTISTLGNAQDFGNLIATNQGIRGTSNKIRGVFSGGDTPTITNTLQYITISSTGNAKDFGDLISTIESQGSCSDSHGGLS